MKKCMKFLSLLLALTLVIGLIPVQTFAASTTYLEVVRDNAPLRAKNTNQGQIVARYAKGTILESTGSCYNYKFNKWYKVPDANGTVRYIFADNVKVHSHSYQYLTYDDVTYKICDCGDVIVSAKTYAEVKKGNALALYATQYGSMAAGAAMSDSPVLPYGDVVGLLILAYGAFEMATGSSISSTKAHEIAIDLDFDEYLKNNPQVCSEASFRLVQRHTGSNLTYLGKQCYNAAQAYVLARFGADVYTKYQLNAFITASMHPGGCYSEIDKNKPDYYYHYHLGANANYKVGGHIFYGATPSGMMPV